MGSELSGQEFGARLTAIEQELEELRPMLRELMRWWRDDDDPELADWRLKRHLAKMRPDGPAPAEHRLPRG